MDYTILKVIAIIFFLASLANFIRVWLRSSTAGQAPSTPAGRHRPGSSGSITTKVQVGSLDVGAAAHQQRGVAKTAKMPLGERPTTPVVTAALPTPALAAIVKKATAPPAVPNDDDEAMDSLFSSVTSGANPGANPGTSSGTSKSALPLDDAARKVSRLEELGFHHSISSSDAAATPAPVVGRSNTAELNSILERIDQFLADEPKDAAAKPAGSEIPTAALGKSPISSVQPKTEMLPSSEAITYKPAALEQKPIEPSKAPDTTSEAPKTTPLWARPDAVDDDLTKADKLTPGEQQRLF